jgi:hypothetical protein
MDFDIEALSRDCDRASFSCGNEALDSYLKNKPFKTETVSYPSVLLPLIRIEVRIKLKKEG